MNSEVVKAGRATVEAHLNLSYFSMFDIRSETAFILMENYEVQRLGILRRRYAVYDLSALRFLLTRLAHEDTHAHLLMTEYGRLYEDSQSSGGRGSCHSSLPMLGENGYEATTFCAWTARTRTFVLLRTAYSLGKSIELALKVIERLRALKERVEARTSAVKCVLSIAKMTNCELLRVY